MCARQMLPQVKSAAKPDKASSQSKTTGPLALRLTYARQPNSRIMLTLQRGRPERSMSDDKCQWACTEAEHRCTSTASL